MVYPSPIYVKYLLENMMEYFAFAVPCAFLVSVLLCVDECRRARARAD